MKSDLMTPLSQLEAVCENATVALFVMDDRQQCIYMNHAAEVLTGYTLAEVQGGPLHGFVHHTHPDGSPFPIADCPIDRAAPRNMQEQGEEIFVHKDGHFYPVAFTASPVRRDGQVVGTVLEVRDIHKEMQRRREAAVMRELSGLMLTDVEVEAVVQAVTDAATDLTGAQFGAFFYNVDDREGARYMLYALSGVPREAFSRFPMPRATPVFGPTFAGRATILSDDIRADPRYGQWAPYHGMPPGHLPVRSYLAVPVASDEGEVLGGIFLGHERVGVFDESAARLVESLAAQAAIGISRAQLFMKAEAARDQAQAEARDKERMYQEATRANQMKDLFLATVSHELRTPLTSILGWTDMLASGRLPPERLTDAIATIARSARAQAQIVEDLLDISRIVSGKLQLDVRPTDPGQVVRAAVEGVRPAAIAKGIHLNVDVARDAGTISGDPERLQQVVWNLLNNAVKFTDRGGHVRLAVRRVASLVEIDVVDNGRGIAPEFLPRLFDRFSQLDSTTTREHGGLGLGLAIVRQLVEMHGGTVAAWSDGPGQGARFVVRLPLAALGLGSPQAAEALQPESAPVSSGPQTHELDGCRVLLVEDDRDSRDMLATVLRHHGAEVVACGSVPEALEATRTFLAEVVVSDIGMPGADGYQFIRELRQQEAEAGRRPVPALALTAYAQAADRMRALASGFQVHVAKPVQPTELLAVVGSLREWEPGSR